MMMKVTHNNNTQTLKLSVKLKGSCGNEKTTPQMPTELRGQSIFIKGPCRSRCDQWILDVQILLLGHTYELRLLVPIQERCRSRKALKIVRAPRRPECQRQLTQR